MIKKLVIFEQDGTCSCPTCGEILSDEEMIEGKCYQCGEKIRVE